MNEKEPRPDLSKIGGMAINIREILGVVAIVAVLGGVAAIYQSLPNDLKEVRNDIAVLKETIRKDFIGVNAELTQLKTSLLLFQATLTGLQSDVSSVKGQLNDQSKDVRLALTLAERALPEKAFLQFRIELERQNPRLEVPPPEAKRN